MANESLPDLHVTGFDVDAGVRQAGPGSYDGLAVPLVAVEIEGRPTPDAADVSLWLRLPVTVARALAVELVEQADRAEQLARRPDEPRRTSAPGSDDPANSAQGAEP
jgi:hypothetical protein